MKKKSIIFVVCFLSIIFTSCNYKPAESAPPADNGQTLPTESPASPAETTPAPLASQDNNSDDEPNGEPYKWVNLTNETDTGGMNIYWQRELDISAYHFPGDENAKLTLYVAADKNDNGEWGFDDGQDWQLLLETSDGAYPLFPRQYVQLGEVSCSVFTEYTDNEDVWHVLVTVNTTASYEIYDCVYDSSKKAFKIESAYDRRNINYLGGSN